MSPPISFETKWNIGVGLVCLVLVGGLVWWVTAIRQECAKSKCPKGQTPTTLYGGQCVCVVLPERP